MMTVRDKLAGVSVFFFFEGFFFFYKVFVPKGRGDDYKGNSPTLAWRSCVFQGVRLDT